MALSLANRGYLRTLGVFLVILILFAEEGQAQMARILPDEQGYSLYDAEGLRIGRIEMLTEGEYALYDNQDNKTAHITPTNDGFLVTEVEGGARVQIKQSEEGYDAYDEDDVLIGQIISDGYGGFEVYAE